MTHVFRQKEHLPGRIAVCVKMTPARASFSQHPYEHGAPVDCRLWAAIYIFCLIFRENVELGAQDRGEFTAICVLTMCPVGFYGIEAATVR
jgi:hypothetical protein